MSLKYEPASEPGDMGESRVFAVAIAPGGNAFAASSSSLLLFSLELSDTTIYVIYHQRPARPFNARRTLSPLAAERTRRPVNTRRDVACVQVR